MGPRVRSRAPDEGKARGAGLRVDGEQEGVEEKVKNLALSLQELGQSPESTSGSCVVVSYSLSLSLQEASKEELGTRA